MVKRYPNIWTYITITGGGTSADGDPLSVTKTLTTFKCDAQTSSGKFIAGVNGDNIPVHYTLFTKVNTGLSNGDKVIGEDGKKYTVLQIHLYTQYEIWV